MFEISLYQKKQYLGTRIYQTEEKAKLAGHYWKLKKKGNTYEMSKIEHGQLSLLD